MGTALGAPVEARRQPVQPAGLTLHPRPAAADPAGVLRSGPEPSLAVVEAHHSSASPDTGLAPEALLVRRPVCDRDGRVVANDLLFRDEREAGPDAERALAHLAAGALAEIGAERLSGGRRAIVGVPARLLLELDPLPFPPDGVLLALRARGSAEQALVLAARRAAARGYSLGIQGPVDRLDLVPLLDVAEVVRLDVARLGRDRTVEEARRLSRLDVALMAVGVGDPETLELCRELGFALFQGDAVSAPPVSPGRPVPISSAAGLRSAAGLTAPEAGLEDIERLISRDVGLSYRLLRFLNSGFFALRHPVASVRQALTVVGEREARRWTMLMLLTTIETERPELVATGLVRARMCDLLAERVAASDPAVFFLTGMLSLADSLVGTPMDEVVASLPLSEEVRLALVHRTGPVGWALEAVLRYERGRLTALREPDGTAISLADLYVRAVAWTDAALAELPAAA